MNEFRERKIDQEITKENFKTQVLERFDTIGPGLGWRCQKEINFTEQPIRPGRIALVQERPKDLNNPSERFKVLFFVGEDNEERQEILKTLDFLIPHELAHVLSDQNNDKYHIKLDDSLKNDLDKSKLINPEHFYSGANELATDVLALKLLEKEGRGDKMAGGIIALLESEKGQEPFYRDEARFEELLDYLENKGLMSDEKIKRAEALITGFKEGRKEKLDNEDQRRFDEMKRYLQEVIQKVEKIEI